MKILVEVKGGDGALLRLVTSQGVEEAVMVNGESFRHGKELRLKQGLMFIRAELGQYADPYSTDRSQEDTVLALTNPVYSKTVS